MSIPLPAAKPPSRTVLITGLRIVYGLVGSLLLAAGCLTAFDLVSGPAEGPALRGITSPVATSTVAPVIVPSPASPDLGVVAQGGHTKSVTILLSNVTDTPVEVAAVWTSCSCLRIDLGPRVIAPLEHVPVEVLLDLSTEPSFTGRLGMSIRGLTSSGAVAFAIPVGAEVVPTQPLAKAE
jgi:hypothetical protein